MSYLSFRDVNWQSYVLSINNPDKIKGYNILVLLSHYEEKYQVSY